MKILSLSNSLLFIALSLFGCGEDKFNGRGTLQSLQTEENLGPGSGKATRGILEISPEAGDYFGLLEQTDKSKAAIINASLSFALGYNSEPMADAKPASLPQLNLKGVCVITSPLQLKTLEQDVDPKMPQAYSPNVQYSPTGDYLSADCFDYFSGFLDLSEENEFFITFFPLGA